MYQAKGGNPFEIVPHGFADDVKKKQYDIYDSRRGGGELRRMRDQSGLKSCPVCGSPVSGDLDHYLPRKLYPEFSIMRANLVPACKHCNSGAKGTTVCGATPERFIHPYFDSWADGELWFVEIIPPYEAATFDPQPLNELPPNQRAIVAFHLAHVLGKQFTRSMELQWSNLPQQIKVRYPSIKAEDLANQLDLELSLATMASGGNSWPAAMFRGILGNPTAIEYLSQKIELASLPPDRTAAT